MVGKGSTQHLVQGDETVGKGLSILVTRALAENCVLSWGGAINPSKYLFCCSLSFSVILSSLPMKSTVDAGI